jgi:hypothetical protein
VICVVNHVKNINLDEVVLVFNEQEVISVIAKLADYLKLSYSFILSWITLTVLSSLLTGGHIDSNIF